MVPSSAPALAAAGCAAAAVGLLGWPSRRAGVLARTRPSVRVRLPWAGLALRRSWAVVLAPPALVVLLAGPSSAVVAVLLGVGTALLLARRQQTAATRTATELTRSVADVATALAADLAAGHPPVSSLAALAEELAARPPDPARRELTTAMAAVLSAARLGGDVPAVLRRRSATPGAEGLLALAAGWEVAEHTGAALAPVLEQVAGGLRDQLAADRAVATALAGSRSTARLLAGLPLVGLAMGAGLGASPVGFLLDTAVGRVCLLLGLGLEVAGLVWTDALARAALRPGRS